MQRHENRFSACRNKSWPWRLASLCALLSISACVASPVNQSGCPDLSGTYSNESSPPGVLLAKLLLKGAEQHDAKTISLVYLPATKRLSVVSQRDRFSLENGRDFVCTANGFELNYTTVTQSALPPLASTAEMTRYTLQKVSGGGLQAQRSVKTSGVAYGFSMAGPWHKEKPLIWRLLPAP